MCELPVHPTVAKILLGSAGFGCSQEIAVIVAMLQVENVYLEPPNQRNKARVAKRNFEVAEGDLLTLLNVFNAYKQQEPGSVRHWCSSRFLNHKALRRADQLYEQVRYR